MNTYTYKNGIGHVCTDETILRKNAEGKLEVPLYEVDGKFFYTKGGLPVIVPDTWPNEPHAKPGMFEPLPQGTRAREMTTEEDVWV